MTRSRRPLTLTAAAIALCLAASGCTGVGDNDVDLAPADVSVPSALPVTFGDKAQWSRDLATDTFPAEVPEGVAAILPGRAKSSLYRVALLDPSTGDTRWVSDDFENPETESVPRIHQTTAGNKSWIIVSIPVAKNELKLDVYSPRGTDDRRKPAASATLTGAGSDTMPTVQVGAEGVVLKNVANPDVGDWEKTTQEAQKKYDAAKKKYDAAKKKKAKSKKEKAKKKKLTAPEKPNLPEKPQSKTLTFNPADASTKAYEGPGSLATAWAEGTLAKDPTDESSFGFVVDGSTVWESSKARPSGTDRSDKGALMEAGPGILIAQWKGSNGKELLAVHEIRTGKVLTVKTGIDPTVVESTQGKPVLHSKDGDWATWGSFVFGLKGGPSSRVDLHGGSIKAINQDILYVSGAIAPLTASAAAKAGEDGDEAESESESDEKFNGMIDAVSGEPLTNTEPDAVPLFVSDSSQGVFVLREDGKTRMFSLPLS